MNELRFVRHTSRSNELTHKGAWPAGAWTKSIRLTVHHFLQIRRIQGVTLGNNGHHALDFLRLCGVCMFACACVRTADTLLYCLAEGQEKARRANSTWLRSQGKTAHMLVRG